MTTAAHERHHAKIVVEAMICSVVQHVRCIILARSMYCIELLLRMDSPRGPVASVITISP
jgi:hypothetical protein